MTASPRFAPWTGDQDAILLRNPSTSYKMLAYWVSKIGPARTPKGIRDRRARLGLSPLVTRGPNKPVVVSHEPAPKVRLDGWPYVLGDDALVRALAEHFRQQCAA